MEGEGERNGMVRKETCAQEHPQIIIITSSNLRLGSAFEFSSMYCQSLHYFKLDYRGLGSMADQHNESFMLLETTMGHVQWHTIT